MVSSEVQRTLVKSPPELWTELSDPQALARHLGELGEVRITNVEPEHTVVWEAGDTSGTVHIKPSGWGTRVTLTVTQQVDHTPADDQPPPRNDPVGPLPEASSPDVAGPAGSASAGRQPGEASSGGPVEDEPPGAGVAPAPVTAQPQEGDRTSMSAQQQCQDAPEPDARPTDAAAHRDQPEPVPQPAAPEAPLIRPEPRLGFLAWLFRRRRRTFQTVEPQPAAGASGASSFQMSQAHLESDPPGLALGAEVSAIPAGSEASVALESRQPPQSPAGSEASQGTESPEVSHHRTGEALDGDRRQACDESTGKTGASEDQACASEVQTGDESEPDGIAAELRAAEEVAAEQVTALLTGVLDRLGAAHHRPFSRG